MVWRAVSRYPGHLAIALAALLTTTAATLSLTWILKLAVDRRSDVREDRALIFCDLAHNETKTFEYSVRPTCAGAFIIPPAYAESMYDRAVNSRGVAGKFTVLPRE